MSQTGKDGSDGTELFDPAKYYEEPSGWDKFSQKSKDNPFVPVGMGVGLAGLAYGIYNFRNRGAMSPSVYLIHLRVGVQGAVIGAFTLGVCYSMYHTYLSESVSDYIHKKKEP